MGALEDILFNALGGAQKPDFKAGDPYAEPQQFVEGALTTPILQAALKPDKGGYGTGELMGAALISGLLGGGLGGLSKDYQNEQKDLYKQYLVGNLLGSSPVNASPELDPSLFRIGQDNLALFGTMNSLEAKKAARDAAAKTQELYLTEGLKTQDPDLFMENARRMGLVKAQPNAEPMIAGEGSELPPPTNPNSARYKAMQDKQTSADSLRKEFSALPEVKNFAQVEKTAQIMKSALEDKGNAMSDLELTRYAILLIEPGMAVREGEQAAVTASQSIPEALKGQMLKALNGEPGLQENAREGLRSLALRSYEGNRKSYDRALDFYKGIAKGKGLDPASVSYLGESADPAALLGPSRAGGGQDKLGNSGSVAPMVGETKKGADGKTYVFID